MTNAAPKTEQYRAARMLLINFRRLARTIIENYNYYSFHLRRVNRERNKLKQQDMTFLPLEKQAQTYRFMLEDSRRRMTDVGEQMFWFLDGWQQAGATLRDLCDLCSKPYQQAVKEISPDRLDDAFSGIMFVHCLDYQHDFSDSGSYDTEVDAPFTHCIKEYMLDQMLTNPDAKRAADEAFEMCFPELAAKMVTPATTAEGETVYFDREGNEVDPADFLQ